MCSATAHCVPTVTVVTVFYIFHKYARKNCIRTGESEGRFVQNGSIWIPIGMHYCYSSTNWSFILLFQFFIAKRQFSCSLAAVMLWMKQYICIPIALFTGFNLLVLRTWKYRCCYVTVYFLTEFSIFYIFLYVIWYIYWYNVVYSFRCDML